jgi:hypothetical protein
VRLVPVLVAQRVTSRPPSRVSAGRPRRPSRQLLELGVHELGEITTRGAIAGGHLERCCRREHHQHAVLAGNQHVSGAEVGLRARPTRGLGRPGSSRPGGRPATQTSAWSSILPSDRPLEIDYCRARSSIFEVIGTGSHEDAIPGRNLARPDRSSFRRGILCF